MNVIGRDDGKLSGSKYSTEGGDITCNRVFSETSELSIAKENATVSENMGGDKQVRELSLTVCAGINMSLK